MPSDDEIARRLQAQVDAERREAIEVQWGDPGPYRLPRCTRFLAAMITDVNTLEIQLETAKGQRVLVPVDGSALEAMLQIISQAIKTAKA